MRKIGFTTTSAMPRPSNKKTESPNVTQDSSLIRAPQVGENGGKLDTLSKVESAYPPKELGTTLPPVCPLTREDDEYHMAHRFRGEAIIFNHYEYDDNLGLRVRKGTYVDVKSLEDTFQKLRFSVRIFHDLTYAEITDYLEKLRKNEYMYIVDCIIVVVLTHGDDGNSLYARDTLYSASELWNPFLAHKCPVLATKPKIFIIQACRGSVASTKVDINKEATTTTDSTKADVDRRSRIPNGEYFSIPAEADILIAYSSFEGRVAHRDTSEGTWYISELCVEILSSWERDDLMTMLTRVNRRVAIGKEHSMAKQMPSIQSTLTRKIFFSDKRKITETCNEEFSTDVPSTPTETKVTRETVPKIWDGLRISTLQPPPRTLPTDREVLRLAKGLRIFLEEEKLNAETYENASVLLLLLSHWESLDLLSRQEAFGKMISFLRTHAYKWKYFEILGLPDNQTETPRSRRSSSASTQTQKAGTLPRPKKPPFKH